jgi:dUTP pyrophosphatase
MTYLRFKKLHEDAVIPEYKTSGAAGMDLHAIRDFNLMPGEIAVLETGLSVEVPEGYELQVRPRSGFATRGLTIVNSPGTIDSDYRGEVKVIATNVHPKNHNFLSLSVKIKKGDRIAQLVLARVHKLPIEEVDELSDTERGSGGFGSTGW